MMEKKVYLNRPEIIRAISLIKEKGEVFELRVLKGSKVWSAYVDDAEIAVNELEKLNLEGANEYITPQRLHEGCRARLQWNRFIEVGKDKIPTTSDSDVIAYKYLLIDLDPVRPSGISSNEEELKSAMEIKELIVRYMAAQGMKSYIFAFSGNSYHLLYPIDYPKNEESVEKVKIWLNRLDELFSTDECHVDVKNCNPSRIFKLYGTLAQKGRDTESRPHRMSKLLEVVDGSDN